MNVITPILAMSVFRAIHAPCNNSFWSSVKGSGIFPFSKSFCLSFLSFFDLFFPLSDFILPILYVYCIANINYEVIWNYEYISENVFPTYKNASSCFSMFLRTLINIRNIDKYEITGNNINAANVTPTMETPPSVLPCWCVFTKTME